MICPPPVPTIAVICEGCDRPYIRQRLRKRDKSRPRLCHSCASRKGVAGKWATFITPPGEADDKRNACALVNARLKHVPDLIVPAACQKCGAGETDLHKHHPDYDRPFHVLFLCIPCHGKGHHRPGFLDGLVPVYIPTAAEFAAQRSAVPA